MPSTQCSEAASTGTVSDGSTAVSAAAVAACPPGHEDLAFSLDNLSLLVEDIRDGFTATMQQLGKIEGQDAELRSRLDTAELATQEKMEALQTAVQQMREQFSSVVARVESLEIHHRQLEGQMEQLDRAAQAEKTQLAGVPCCQQFDHRATCQTPMTPYSCATPLSPDSGRPGTCTPSCFHSNEFQSSEHIARSDALGSESARPTPQQLHRSGSTATMATTASSAAAASGTPVNTSSNSQGVRQGQQLLPCHHGAATTASCEAVAERSLHMSRALADRFARADSSSEDCELDSSPAESASSYRLNGASNGRDQQPDSRAGGRGTMVSLQQQCKRHRVCQEIVDTERKYCFCLWTIIDLIAESLKSATFMTMKDLCLIFPKCLPRLHELHSTFLGLLEDRLGAEQATATAAVATASQQQQQLQKQPASPAFSAVVLDFLQANNGELLDLYRDYANDFGTAVRTIRKYQQHSGRFRQLMHSLQHHPSCEGLDLTAFLLTPVQRMPRYLLLMRQLAACTPAGHPDQASLDSVLARLHCLLDELNYSIQTALRQAAAGSANMQRDLQQHQQQHQQPQSQQQQQQRWKRSRSLPRPVEASAPSTSAFAAAALADADSLLSGSSGRSGRDRRSDGRHFLVASAAAARCRSVPPQQQQYQHQQQQQLHRQSPLRMESPKMGPRSRLVSRQLRTADRCLSAGDILRASPVSPTSSSSLASTTATCEERLHQRLMRRGTPPKSTLKESFRRMFQSRRKSSLAKLESLPNSGSTFEDENGDPCTDV